MKESYRKMLKKLKKEFNEAENEDMIFRMFEERVYDIYTSVAGCEEYKNKSREISIINNEVRDKYKNSFEILTSFERYSGAIYAKEYISDKLLYKYGLMDGMRLVIDGLREVDFKNI